MAQRSTLTQWLVTHPAISSVLGNFGMQQDKDLKQTSKSAPSWGKTVLVGFGLHFFRELFRTYKTRCFHSELSLLNHDVLCWMIVYEASGRGSYRSSPLKPSTKCIILWLFIKTAHWAETLAVMKESLLITYDKFLVYSLHLNLARISC